MLKIKKKITNPMTVIAIFAAISETSAAVSLPFLENKEREIYVWFLIGFPFYLLLLFFVTLNFNYRSLYSPSDFEKDKNFLKAGDLAHLKVEETPASRNAQRPHTTTDPPDNRPGASNLLIEHDVHLPESVRSLQIVDVRQMETEAGIAMVLDNIRQAERQYSRMIVLLTSQRSDPLLRERLLHRTRQAKKHTGGTFCIVYNASSHGLIVAGRL
jgi:hypothetical protein